MKTKEDAAKLLLEAGWTLEEVNEVLAEPVKYPYIQPVPYPVPCPQPIWPSPYTPYWGQWTITCDDTSTFTTTTGTVEIVN